jgi:hypothetical protein
VNGKTVRVISPVRCYDELQEWSLDDPKYLAVVLTQIGYILDYPHGLHLAA